MEKDRYVRNSTPHLIPGVDTMQSFRMTREEFEKVFIAATQKCASGHYLSSLPPLKKPDTFESKVKTGMKGRIVGLIGRIVFGRRPSMKSNKVKAAAKDVERGGKGIVLRNSDGTLVISSGPKKFDSYSIEKLWKSLPKVPPRNKKEGAKLADNYRVLARALQNNIGDLEKAGEFFASAVDWHARFGNSMCLSNADIHTEYAQNLCRRGLIAEAEYHLRCAADIYRQLGLRKARKYGDVLLYLAVLIDRQGRLTEAENFYKGALGVYRSAKIGDYNVRLGIDNLSHNLRAQGRANEVLAIAEAQYNGVVLI